MKKNTLNEEVLRIRQMMGLNKNIQEDANTDFIDGVEVIREIDGVKFIDFSNLCDVVAERNGIDRMDWERMDEIEELSHNWIKENNACLHTFWDDDKYSAYYDGFEKAKKENKNIVVLEYNS